jgi:hypothetical protein
MLTTSAFLFLVLNLVPSPTLRSPHAPTACFAVAAAHDAPSSLRGLLTINANNPNGNNNANNPSFASLIWGNNQQQNATNAINANNATNANNAAGQATPAHASATTTDNTNSKNDDARHMIHLELINSSSWRDPAGVTFYQAEVSR